MSGIQEEKSETGTGISGKASFLMGKLKLDPGKWKCSHNAVVKGKSGLEHKFDLLLETSNGSGRIITCMFLGNSTSGGSARLSTFYAHSRDVMAFRMAVLAEGEVSMEEGLLSSSLGVELLKMPGSNPSAEPFRAVAEPDHGNVTDEHHQHKESRQNSGKGRKKYRDRTQIIHEILTSTSSEDGATITKIIFRCNLNYNSARSIISDMVKKELIAISPTGENKKVYRITRIGSNLLEKLHFYDSINGVHSTF